MKMDPWIELIEDNGWTDMQLSSLIAAAEVILYERRLADYIVASVEWDT